MKASDWISVKDRLPRKNQRVIVCRTLYNGERVVDIATYTGKDNSVSGIYWWYLDDGFDTELVTHWQKIVLPKKEES